MRPFLLDVNVLLSLVWPNLVHHEKARRWFERNGHRGFRTCPTTQTGFVRISVNPSFHESPMDLSTAVSILDQVTSLQSHQFWPDDLVVRAAVEGFVVKGHRQLTDAYLLGLARAKGGVVATLDRGLVELAGEDSGLVELLL